MNFMVCFRLCGFLFIFWATPAFCERWGDILLVHDVESFVIDQAPSDEQLISSRSRTINEIENCKFDPQEPRTFDKASFRCGLRAHWLQLNLEYQAFLTGSGNQREFAAKEALQQYHSVMSYLLYEAPTVENIVGGVVQIPAEPREVTLLSSGENEIEWQEVRPFLDLVYHDVSASLPAEAMTAKQIVRSAYFNGIAPSQDSGINEDIRTTVGQAFQDIQILGKEAIAAKVQAAVVMRRFYGVTPQATRLSFQQPRRPNESLAENSLRQVVKLPREEEELFPNETKWQQVGKLIKEVTSGGVGGGIVSDYLVINLSLDENGGKSKRRTGYDGLLKDVKDSFVDKANNKVKDDATAFYEYKDEILNFRGVLSRSYGRYDGAPNANSATLWDLMKAANSQSASILAKINEWANTPGQESLDGLFAYEIVDSVVSTPPHPANGDAIALAVAPETRIERKWFETLTTSDSEADSSLMFDIRTSNDALAASKIPDIELKSTYSSQVDVLIRKLAASFLLNGRTLTTPETNTQDAQQHSEMGEAGIPVSSSTASRGGTSSVGIVTADGFDNRNSALHKRLLSRHTLKLRENDQPRTIYELLVEAWDLYLPSQQGMADEFVRESTVEWLIQKLKDAKASQLTERLPMATGTSTDMKEIAPAAGSEQ